MRIIGVIFYLLTISWANAADYGVVGTTYVIAEQDFLQYIEQKIKSMQANGQWDELQNKFQKQVQAHIERPTPLNLPRAQDNKTYYYNPSIEAPYDVRDIKGQIIVQKGMVINPLDRIHLSSTLLFFNGDDKEQLAWALDESKKYPLVKLVITSGSIKSTTHYFKRAVYFDLNGFLVNKFHIRAVPARIAQYGNRLQISEVKL